MTKWIKDNIFNALGFGVIFSFIFLFLTVALGDRFFGMYTRLNMAYWISNPGGVYADCRKGEFKKNKFCVPEGRSSRPADENWRTVTKGGSGGMAFSLN